MKTVPLNTVKTITALALGMSVLFPLAALAGPKTVLLQNEMAVPIKAVSCIKEDPAKEGTVLGALAEAGASQAVEAAKLEDCSRLVVALTDGTGFQVYPEHNPGAAKNITFSLETLTPAGKETFPLMTLEENGEFESTPAGIPFWKLCEQIQFGLQEASYTALSTPQSVSKAGSGHFAVAFAGTSWSVQPGSMVYDDTLAKGMSLLTAIDMEAEFANPVLVEMFRYLQETGAVPWVMEFTGEKGAFSPEALAEESGYTLLPGMDADDDGARWELLLGKKLEEIADAEGTARIVLVSPEFRFELTLHLDTAKAVLKVIRSADAALG